ncbi:tape measure protein [Raoultella ornithinolytica]|uniref:tape measure protein n=1 Tax=Raoultella ornithinolytica TaxID=54291 RepID=UPI001F1E3FCD|nr:tape measure protein [Raoultella ornithinolytica]MCF6660712.1 tape measure protein [Raoultella ornithinolytica]
MAENAGGIYYDVEMNIQGLLVAQQRVNQHLDLMERGFDKTTKSIDTTESSMLSLSRVAVSLGAALSVKQIAEYADAWATVNNKLSNSLRPNEQLVDVTQRVFDITQQTRGSLDATASLYARLERATRQYGTSAGDLSKLTTIINQGFVVSGATAQEAENAIIQLSQGLASGALRGEEFNSVNEQGNRLIVALADSMGVSIGEMRNMAAQGKLTTDVVVNGLLSQGAVIGKEFANTTTTISQALQVAGNNVTKFFGENSTVKSFSAVFSSSIITASENLGALSNALMVASVLMGGRYAAALAMATAEKVKNTVASAQQAAAERQLAKDELGASQAVLRRATVEQEAAISERARAEQTLANLKATNALTVTEVAHAEAEVASIKVSLQQLQAEKALEAQRLKAQITEQGRIATATRMAEIRQAEAVLTGQLARAESVAQHVRGAAYEAASAQIVAANTAVATTTDAVRVANGRVAASQEVVAATSFTMMSALKSVNSFLLPLGGVTGILLAVAAGWYLYAQNQAQARKESIAFADTLPDVIQKLKEMNLAQAEGVRADTISSIKAQKEAIEDLEGTISGLQSEYDKYITLARQYGVTEDENNGYVIRARDAANELAKKRRDLDGATATLQQSEDALKQINSQVNQSLLEQMKAARDNALALAEAEKKASFLGGTQEYLAEKLGQTTTAMQKFNTESLKIDWGGKEGEKLIKQAERRLELSKLEGEAKARQQAAYDAEDAGITDGLAIKRLQDSYAATERNTQAIKDQKKENSSAASEAKKLAAQQESVTQKLDKLRAAQDLSTESVEKRRIQEAGLRAEQSLGSAATQKQLDEARALGQANEQAAISIQKRAQAEQANKAATQLQAQADTSVDPRTGQAVNPLAEVDLEESQRLALYKKYYDLGLIDINTFEATKTAIHQLAANERNRISQEETDRQQQNMSQLLGASSDFFGQMAGLVGDYAGESSAAYKTLFAVSKAFSIAQATMNMVMAISNAAALPWPANIPAIAVAAAQGANLISQIRGSNYSGGRKNGGPVTAGSVYPVGEGNLPELMQTSKGLFMIPGDDGRVFSNKDVTSGSPSIKKASTGSEYLSQASGSSGSSGSQTSKSISVNVQFYDQTSGGQHSFEAQAMQQGNVLTVDAFLRDLDSAGPMASGMESTYGLRRQANGDY